MRKAVETIACLRSLIAITPRFPNAFNVSNKSLTTDYSDIKIGEFAEGTIDCLYPGILGQGC